MPPPVTKSTREVRNRMARDSVVDGYSSLIRTSLSERIEPHIVEGTICQSTIGQCERTWGYELKPDDFSAKVEYDDHGRAAVVSISYAVDSLALSLDIRNLWVGVMKAVNRKEGQTLVRCLVINGSIYPLR